MKKQTNILIVAIILFAVLAIGGCKKAETKTKTQLLTTGTWKWNAQTVSPAKDGNGDGVPETDWLAVMAACSKDDFFTFNTNGTELVDEGLSKCFSSSPQNFTSTWAFSSNETKIDAADIVDATIITLDENTFKATEVWVDSGITYTRIYTFKH